MFYLLYGIITITTSTRISLWFCGLVVGVTVLLSLLSNFFFYKNRSRAEQRHVEKYIVDQSRKGLKRPLVAKNLQGRFAQVIRVEKNDDYYTSVDTVLKDRVFLYNEHRYIAKKDKEVIYLKDVSSAVEKQKTLLFLSLFAILLSGIFGYVLSKVLIKQGLVDLHILYKEVSAQHIGNLDGIGTYDHLPKNDEIAVLAQAFRENSLMLKQQIEDMQQFIANASHELRTPLMSLRAHQDLAKKTKHYEGLIENNIYSIEHMQKVIDGLLMISQPVSELENDQKEVVITDILDGLVADYTMLYNEKSITVEKYYADTNTHKLPEIAWTTVVKNIIENAWKYSAEGGMITIKTNVLSVTITNRGTIIKQEDIDNIRKVFRQADGARNDQGGFGLGLSIAQRLCSLYGWTISVESDEKNGTTFIVDWKK